MLSLGTGTATLTPVLHISDMSWPIKSFFKLLQHFGLSQMASRNSLDTITNQQLFPQLKQTLSFQAQRFFAPLHLAWSAAFRTMVRSQSSCWSFLMSCWLGRSSKTCEMGATAWCSSRPHWLQGNQKSPSAFRWLFPCRCTMLKLKFLEPPRQLPFWILEWLQPG